MCLVLKSPLVLLVAAAGVGAGAARAHHHPGYSLSRRWNAFQRHHLHHLEQFSAGDTSNIATANLTVPIVNGVLNVNWCPHTASAGAQYNVTFASARGESVHRSVGRASQRPACGCATCACQRYGDGTRAVHRSRFRSATSPAYECVGRPPHEGAGYSIGRTAIINSSGQIDAAAGNLGDCMHVDGTSGACGTAGSGGRAESCPYIPTPKLPAAR